MQQVPSVPTGRHPRFLLYLALAAFTLIAGFLLVAEHRAHLLGVLPYLLLLACPLMHLLMHGGGHGHGGHRHGAGASGGEDRR